MSHGRLLPALLLPPCSSSEIRWILKSAVNLPWVGMAFPSTAILQTPAWKNEERKHLQVFILLFLRFLCFSDTLWYLDIRFHRKVETAKGTVFVISRQIHFHENLAWEEFSLNFSSILVNFFFLLFPYGLWSFSLVIKWMDFCFRIRRHSSRGLTSVTLSLGPLCHLRSSQMIVSDRCRFAPC